ncbi:Preprotein translocase secY subunit [Clostridiaceae bacterium JG1575]|nr:Preprotein translocase secY subunit [Clostridiaceae bacterium JG1575]
MFEIFTKAWKTKELQKRMLFMLLIVFIYRLGNHITVPYVNPKALANLTNQGDLFGLYNLISGGALGRFSLFALGVVPYINASIIVQLLTAAIPALENLQKEGEEGRKKIQNWTRYASIAIGALQAYGTYVLVANTGAITNRSWHVLVLILLTLVAGTVFLMWLGDQITTYGIGNGISVLIFINIISRLPQSLQQLTLTASTDPMTVILVVLLLLALFVGVVYFSLGERRIPVQYAGRMVNGRAMKAQTQHLPIAVASSAVLGIIFAMSMMEFPATLHQLMPNNTILNAMATSKLWWNPFNRETWMYVVLYFILVVFFCVFYTSITMKPDEMAENMQKSGGYVNGIKPGKSTETYLEGVFNRVSFYAGIFAGVIAIFPLLVGKLNPAFQQMNFGGTVLFIMVGVALDTIRQLESQLMTRHYKGFLK